MSEEECQLTQRMYNTGDYLIKSTSGNYFWANTNISGCLKEAASSEEVYIIQKLAREGRGGVIHETKSYRL